MTGLLTHIMSSAFNIMLPFGFSFGIFCVAVWTLPMIVRLFKSIF